MTQNTEQTIQKNPEDSKRNFLHRIEDYRFRGLKVSRLEALIDTDEPEKLGHILDTIVDPAGTFYRFSLPDSIMSELKYK